MASEFSGIGETTNEDGPLADNCFLVFVTRHDPGWFEGSFDGEGRDELVRELFTLLGCEIPLELFHSATYVSPIRWPERMRGETPFDLEPQGLLMNRQGPGITHANPTASKRA